MKKLKPIYPTLLTLVLASIVLNSCYFISDCIDGSGEIITESRLVSEFYSVENTTSIDVEIIADTVYKVEVTADDNLLQFIDTYVRHDNLIIDIDYNHCFNSSSNIYVEVHMPILEMVESSGSGDMAVYDFDCSFLSVKSSGSGDIDLMNIYCINQVDIVSSGSGDIRISGKAANGDYRLAGSGDIWADDLSVDECYVNNSGSGNAYCLVYDLLDVTITGSGDVYYEGPIDSKDIHEYISGSGELRRR